MDTIAKFVSSGIQTKKELENALRLAMKLEFATLPPYLCAEWSIDPGDDPDVVASVINDIAVQEMYHFALAGNILAGLGGSPEVDRADFVSSYPTHELPGGIRQPLPIDLKPLSHDQLRVFVQIEKPEFPPVAAELALTAATIGEFYTRMEEALRSIRPAFDPQAHAVRFGEAVPIRNLTEALAAIGHIKEEGEGTSLSPDQAISGNKLAHYYAFKELLEGRKLKQTGADWRFDGAPVRLPKVFNFDAATGGNESVNFNRTFTKLLKSLQSCWTTAAAPDVGAMFDLKAAGVALVRQGNRPEFKWDESG